MNVDQNARLPGTGGMVTNEKVPIDNALEPSYCVYMLLNTLIAGFFAYPFIERLLFADA